MEINKDKKVNGKQETKRIREVGDEKQGKNEN